jgi:hypothetical protein
VCNLLKSLHVVQRQPNALLLRTQHPTSRTISHSPCFSAASWRGWRKSLKMMRGLKQADVEVSRSEYDMNEKCCLRSSLLVLWWLGFELDKAHQRECYRRILLGSAKEVGTKLVDVRQSL